VAGDELLLQLAVEAGAGALVTAPGATKVYRSGGGEVSVLQKFEVAAAASLEWLPHEVIVFDGARLKARSRVSLATDARFIGFETLCLGRPASGLPFSLGSCDSRLDIEVAGRTLLHERQYWTPETLSSASAPAGLGGHSYVGSLYAWPGDARALTAARAALAGSSVRAGVTLLDGLLVVRALAASLPVVRRLLVQAWEALRPIVIGRAASPPRIWAT
jgi:urease accessory protein